MTRPLALLLLAALALAAPAAAQPVEVLGVAEVTLTSAWDYADPHREGALTVTFSGPAGQAITVYGFWDGGRTFRARFAPPAPGTWAYRSVAADVSNPGLHDVTGAIEVVPYAGSDPFRARGWPRVSADGRHLTYGDGTPFFLLADYALEAAWRSEVEDIRAYLDNRAAKGFGAVHVVASSHNRHFPEGVTNQLGEPLHPPFQPEHLNPRYFDYLDEVVSAANERGVAVMLYPIWAATTEMHQQDNDWYGWYVPDEATRFRARYVAARYAGHNVIWVSGGDQYYDRPEEQAFWAEVGRIVDEASGGTHLLTAHSSGWSGTFQYFDGGDDWLDFHAYTPGHWAHGYWSYEGALSAVAAQTGKPLFSIESNFEDLFHRFWDFLDDTTATFRLADVHVREAAYWGVLSGSLAGYSYGANGVWQWTTEETVMEVGDILPRFTALDALNFPGAFQMMRFRQLMEALPWTSLSPRQDLLLDVEASLHVSAAAGEGRILAYLPQNTTAVTLSTASLGPGATYRWHDVRTGASTAESPASFPTQTVQPPDARDWLLILSAAHLSDTTAGPPRPTLTGSIAPNPFRGRTTLHLSVPGPSSVDIAVYDVLGRRVHHRALPVTASDLEYPLDLPTSGVYVCQVRVTNAVGTDDILTLKVLNLD